MIKTAKEVFDEWGQDKRAKGLEDDHWPSVSKAFEMISENNGNYLEIGVGNGYAIEHMANNQFKEGNCLGIDISSAMVAQTKKRLSNLKNVKIKQADFMNLDFSVKIRFDIIFSMEVFYYFSDMQKAIEKTYSLLNPGGQLWILVNYYLENTQTHYWPEMLETTMHLWPAADYHKGLLNAGFKDVHQIKLQVSEEMLESSYCGIGTLCTYGIR